jgi:hypothetical protein
LRRRNDLTVAKAQRCWNYDDDNNINRKAAARRKPTRCRIGETNDMSRESRDNASAEEERVMQEGLRKRLKVMEQP